MAAVTGAVIGAGVAIKGQRDAKKQASRGMEAQQAENEANRAFLEKQAQQARGDVAGLFPQARQEREQGTQRAIDVLTGALPQQFGAFQQGNVAAQQQLAAGLPQIQNALLGLPVDFQSFQPTEIDFGTQFAQPPQAAFQPRQEPISGTDEIALFKGRIGDRTAERNRLRDLWQSGQMSSQEFTRRVQQITRDQRSDLTSLRDGQPGAGFGPLEGLQGANPQPALQDAGLQPQGGAGVISRIGDRAAERSRLRGGAATGALQGLAELQKNVPFMV